MNIKTSIQSAANPQFKQLKKLAHQAKERRRLKQTLLDGTHLISALASQQQTPSALFIKSGIDTDHQDIRNCFALYPDVTVTEISATLFDQISPVETPTGLLALYDIPEVPQQNYQFGILLERIQDPGNLGAILRTVAAAGAESVFLSKECVDAWAPKTLRAGMGAHFVLDIHENTDLARIAGQFSNIIATSLQAKRNLFELDLTTSLAFIFGNEGAGLSPEAQAIATQTVKIPMPGAVESLNVAAAAAVCAFERVRQLNQ